MARRGGIPPYIGTLLIWLVTGLLAMGIVFAAIVISRNNQGDQTTAQQVVTPSPGVAAPSSVRTEARSPRRPAPPVVTQQQDSAADARASGKASLKSHLKEPAERAVALDDVLYGNFPRRIDLSGDRLTEGKRYPLDFTCYRQNKSPALSWSGVPSEAKSLALLFVRDRGEEGMPPFVNWLVYNIAPSNEKIATGQPNKEDLPAGIRQGRNDHRNIGYTGPCEPKGKYPYRFYLIALDEMLPESASPKATDIYAAMKGHVLDYDTLDMTHYLQY